MMGEIGYNCGVMGGIGRRWVMGGIGRRWVIGVKWW